MPFIITRREHRDYPMFLASDGMWDARKREAAILDENEADAIAADINRHSSTEAIVEGVRMEVQS